MFFVILPGHIAIPYGTDLFTAMEDDPNVPMSLISECAFNLGILYRNQGSTLYNNEVIKYFEKNGFTITNNLYFELALLKSALANCPSFPVISIFIRIRF